MSKPCWYCSKPLRGSGTPVKVKNGRKVVETVITHKRCSHNALSMLLGTCW